MKKQANCLELFFAEKNMCPIFLPAFGCCAPQRLFEILIFSIFSAKNLKNTKSNKFAAKFSKKTCFLSLHQNAGQAFYSQIKLTSLIPQWDLLSQDRYKTP